ncbi:uncharacterized protein [Clytia hemisphaerica]|uniref:Uncharacterized protein n=1 Tax=Clytia hemisphaerica TaxID=252671 RepID=A0A7M5X6W9_9CNID
MTLHAFAILLQICVVHSQWFEGQQTNKGNFLNEGNHHTTAAYSPTECVLKCRRECMESFFIEKEMQCYCLDKDGDDGNVVLPNKTGLLYKEVAFVTKADKASKQRTKCCRKCSSGKTFKNCKDVQQRCPLCAKQSDSYMLEFSGYPPTKAFCEMVTDGGGWLVTGNITLEDESSKVSVYNTYIDASSLTIPRLNEVTTGKFMLTPTEMQTLLNESGYTEIRIRCSKPVHNRTIDAVVYGESTIHLFITETQLNGMCSKIRFLDGDNSQLSSFYKSNCNKLRMRNNEIYWNHFVYRAPSHILLDKWRWECDDNKHSGDLRGYWMFFIR